VPAGPADGSAEWAWCESVAEESGGAFYRYDEDVLRRTVAEITDAAREHLPSMRFHYAYKANYTPAVCRAVADMGWGAEVDSPMLLWLAQRIGVPAPAIAYNGIARDPRSVREALLAGAVVNIDAESDVEVVRATARESVDLPLHVTVRLLSPTGRYTGPRLGQTLEGAHRVVAALREVPGVEILGLSAHVPDSTPEGMRTRIRTLLEAGTRLFPGGPGSDGGPRMICVGGALSSRATDIATEVSANAAIIAAELRTVPWGSTVEVAAEPGGAVVAAAFDLVARVVDVREQPGRTVINVAGSILDTSPNTRRVDFPVRVISPSPRERAGGVRLVGGGTLIDGDWLSVDVPEGASPQVGDFLAFGGVGAYSVSLDSHFGSPPLAIVSRTGEGPGAWTRVRDRPGFAETLAGFDLGT